MEIKIAYVTDEAYVMPTCVSIVSLLENSADEHHYQIYVVANDISDKSEEELEKLSKENASITILNADTDKYRALASNCINKGIHVSYTAIYKFDLPTILAGEDKVLYLDGDTIINKDISDLYAEDVSGGYLAAVDDMLNKKEVQGTYLGNQIGLTGNHYFNSGVMLLNLKKMREDNTVSSLVEYRRSGINYFMDQDALNTVLAPGCKLLPCRYNFMSTSINRYSLQKLKEFCYKEYDTIEDCIADQSILHLTDKIKPWEYNIPWFTELFQKYYNKWDGSQSSLRLSSSLKYYCDKIAVYEEKINRISEELVNKKQWRFPYDKIPYGSSVVLYGAGDAGRDIRQQISHNHFCEIIIWIDKKEENPILDIKKAECIKDYNYDYVLIAISSKATQWEVERYLEQLGVEKGKIIGI